MKRVYHNFSFCIPNFSLLLPSLPLWIGLKDSIKEQESVDKYTTETERKQAANTEPILRTMSSGNPIEDHQSDENREIHQRCEKEPSRIRIGPLPEEPNTQP